MKIEKIRVPQKLYTEMYEAILDIEPWEKSMTAYTAAKKALELMHHAYRCGRVGTPKTFDEYLQDYD